MRLKYLCFCLPFFVAFFLIPGNVSAHQPRLVDIGPVEVLDAEVSKAFYDNLTGEPRVYKIDAAMPFNLYLNLLVPKNANPEGRYSAEVYKIDGGRNLIISLPAGDKPWGEFYEEFAGDWYLRGPEIKQPVPAGEYEVAVFSDNNFGKYSLAIGEKEAFPFSETYNALVVIPKLKKYFFNESPVTFVLSILGPVYLVILLGLGMVIGLIYRFVLKRLAKTGVRRAHKNIGAGDRIIRLFIALALLFFGICTTWNPLILIFSGFCFFEAIFSWCGLYAAIGKNTCPMP